MNLSRFDKSTVKRYSVLRKQANIHFLQSKKSKYHAHMSQQYATDAANLLLAADAEADLIVDILKNGQRPAAATWEEIRWDWSVVASLYASNSVSKSWFYREWMMHAV
jgi:hypothetical protein